MTATLDLAPCLRAGCHEGVIHVSYADSIEVSFPATANRRLRTASEAQLNHIEIGHFGLHWPELDEDLSHAGLRAGRYGQP